LGVNGRPLAYVARPYFVVHEAAEDPADDYLTVEQDIIHRAPQSEPVFRNERRTVWDTMFNICGHNE
jgi:hypothetical protein